MLFHFLNFIPRQGADAYQTFVNFFFLTERNPGGSTARNCSLTCHNVFTRAAYFSKIFSVMACPYPDPHPYCISPSIKWPIIFIAVSHIQAVLGNNILCSIGVFESVRKSILCCHYYVNKKLSTVGNQRTLQNDIHCYECRLKKRQFVNQLAQSTSLLNTNSDTHCKFVLQPFKIISDISILQVNYINALVYVCIAIVGVSL